MTKKTYEIHPAIGIARLGSSPLSTEAGYFLGPEPDGSPPTMYRDPAGYLKRQAARFRVFVCMRGADGKLLESREILPQEVRKVTWTVHLANRKGCARRRFSYPFGFRNNVGNDPDKAHPLIIDPGPRSVSSQGERQAFDTGKFRTTPVMLGEIQMDRDGRLRVLGGFGRSGSDPPQPRLAGERAHFADNDNWFDDTSDGPVTARIELASGDVVESRAWVIVAPPDFAPKVTNLITLYDLLFDLAVRRGLRKAPGDDGGPLSFTRQVRPLLERAIGYRWVNRWAQYGGPDRSHGTGFGPGDDPGRFWASVADASPAAAPLRKRILDRLRNPDPRGPQPDTDAWRMMPRITDAPTRRTDPGNVLPMTLSQYRIMRLWADGDFINDLDHPARVVESLPDALDRVALEACVGGPLYPGIEASGFVLTDTTRYVPGEAFQLSHSAVLPGEVTQANAIPWQADFLVCRWEESSGVMPRRLAWWPGQRPDDVFSAPGATEMVQWDRGIGEEYQDMVDKWDRLGIVVDRGTPDAPFFVETDRDIESLGP